MYAELENFLLNSTSEPSIPINQELREYLLVIKPNRTLHTQITEILFVYNNTFIRTANDENLIFVQLLELSRTLFPALDPKLLISSVFATFFIYALSDISPGGVLAEHRV